jgi:Carbohydrate esterase, sialic acid-specific acetylesterase
MSARYCKAATMVFFVFPVIAKRPVKVFLLAGQSNMGGIGSIKHLRLLVNESSGSSSNEYRDSLWNGTAFKESDNVYIKYGLNHGKLTVGETTGFAAPTWFGPEAMFGWTVGNAFPNEPVILIKTAWGGKTLAIDFRPPSSGRGNYSGVQPYKYGQFYREMVQGMFLGLNNITGIYPDYDKEIGYEMAGLVWFQGYGDVGNTPFVEEYGFNLVNLIRDLRRDLGAPALPVIIGELGMHGLNPTGRGSDQVKRLRKTQLEVTQLEEFRNNTLFVRTAPFVVANGSSYEGFYHYNGRADTIFHIGEAFGRGMLQLMNNPEQEVTSEGRRLRGSSDAVPAPFGVSFHFLSTCIFVVFVLRQRKLVSMQRHQPNAALEI